jgi:hypothetical protein
MLELTIKRNNSRARRECLELWADSGGGHCCGWHQRGSSLFPGKGMETRNGRGRANRRYVIFFLTLREAHRVLIDPF